MNCLYTAQGILQCNQIIEHFRSRRRRRIQSADVPPPLPPPPPPPPPPDPCASIDLSTYCTSDQKEYVIADVYKQPNLFTNSQRDYNISVDDPYWDPQTKTCNVKVQDITYRDHIICERSPEDPAQAKITSNVNWSPPQDRFIDLSKYYNLTLTSPNDITYFTK